MITRVGRIGSEVSQMLVEGGAIRFSRQQPFILASGWASPVYIDVRVILGEPALRRYVTELAARYVENILPPNSVDVIVGAETAGIPFASWLADRLELKLRYVRKQPLGVGRNAQVEGGSVEGLRALLVDDLTTDGASKVAFARGLRAAGANVEHILTIFYYNVFPGAGKRLADAGLNLHALATWKDLLGYGLSDALSAEDRSEIECFLADPVSWSATRGGRMTLSRSH